MKNVTNHVGSKIGNYTVLYQWVGENYRLYGLCLCDCGTEKVVRVSHMIQGKIVSCGCVAKEKIRTLNLSHGEAHKTKEYMTWKAIRYRCYNKKSRAYKWWGGRGIIVCDRWLESYENFLSDMGRAPSKSYSIDRINNDGNYEPGNCRWATRQQQRRNQRENNGKMRAYDNV